MASLVPIIQLAWRNLIRKKRRTLAVLLTVAIGTGSLFLFDGFNTGIMNQYRENTIRSRYGHGQVNLKNYHEEVFEKPWEHWIEKPEVILSKLKSLPGVEQVFPRVQFYALLTNGQITLSGKGQGIDGVEEAKFFKTLNVEEGKTLTDEPDGIVLGIGLAHALKAKPGDRVTVLSSTIHGSMNGLDFIVTGIFHTGAKEFDDSVFRIPLKAAQTLLDTERVESIALGLRKLSDWGVVAQGIVTSHPELEAVPFAVLDKVYYQNAVDWLASQFRVIRGIILLIVVLGIFNTVSTGVLERKQEVGNLRANGESAWDVLALFLTEGMLLGIGGALLGIVLTWILTQTVLAGGILMPPSPGLTRQYFVRIELQALGGIATFLLGFCCAAVGTFLAAFKVTRMEIGTALRAT